MKVVPQNIVVSINSISEILDFFCDIGIALAGSSDITNSNATTK